MTLNSKLELSSSTIALLIVGLKAYQDQPSLELTIQSLMSMIDAMHRKLSPEVHTADVNAHGADATHNLARRRLECKELLHAMEIALKQQLSHERLQKAQGS